MEAEGVLDEIGRHPLRGLRTTACLTVRIAHLLIPPIFFILALRERFKLHPLSTIRDGVGGYTDMIDSRNPTPTVPPKKQS